MKTKPPKAARGHLAKPAVRKMSTRPRIRMQKLKPVPPGAFPTAAAAFPTDAGPVSPGDAMTAQPGAMPTGAAPGDMTE